jgi:hypothetical protein
VTPTLCGIHWLYTTEALFLLNVNGPRQRNDIDMERWVAEIKLRADVRIGEISKGLETGAGRPNSSQPREKLSKAQTLKAAGISTSAAHRAEQLAENPGGFR